MDSWLRIAVGIVVGVAVLVALLYAVSKALERREPYASFSRLRTREKVRFFRLLGSSPDLPRRVKVLPLLLAAYLAFPIDLVPDFIPVLGYVDDVAIVLGVLALVVRWTPRTLIDDLIARARNAQ